MAKHTKTLEKLCAKPTPADIKWDELKGLLGHLGFKMLPGGGSRRKFVHEEKRLMIHLHQPHPSPDVGKKCVDEVVEYLKTHGFI